MADLVAKRWTDEGDVGQGEPDPVGAPDQAELNDASPRQQKGQGG